VVNWFLRVSLFRKALFVQAAVIISEAASGDVTMCYQTANRLDSCGEVDYCYVSFLSSLKTRKILLHFWLFLGVLSNRHDSVPRMQQRVNCQVFFERVYEKSIFEMVLFWSIVCNSTGDVTIQNASNSYCCSCDGCNQARTANTDNCPSSIPDQLNALYSALANSVRNN
jgi:hypothetical protein